MIAVSSRQTSTPAARATRGSSSGRERRVRHAPGIRVGGGDHGRLGRGLADGAQQRDRMRLRVETPHSPTFTNAAPLRAAPSAASAAVPGRLGMSPIAALTGSSVGTAARTAAITAGDGAPSEPSAGFLTSTTSAPAAAATRASPASTTLTSSFTTALHAGAAVVERHELHAPFAVDHPSMRPASSRPAASLPTTP